MILFGNILGCIFWGAVAAFVATGLVFVLWQKLSGGATSPFGYVVLALLFLLAGAQGSMIAGSLYLKSYVADVRESIEALVPDIEADDADAALQNYDAIRDRVIEEYPMLKPFADKIDPKGISAYVAGGGSAVAGYVTDELGDSLGYYALRRVLWLIGFFVAALLACVLLFSYRSSGSTDFGSQSASGGPLQF